MKKKKYDSLLLGLISGLVMPLIVLLFFYLLKFNHKTFSGFIDHFLSQGVLTHIISLCALPNLLLFFICIWTDRYNPARGIIGATFIYTIIVLILKSI